MHRHYIYLKKGITVPAFASLKCPSCQRYLNLIRLFSNEEVQLIAENILGENHCGFCKGRLHIDTVLTIKQIMKKRRESDESLYLLFLG
jgi:hypothetical protein